jgi:hypothetical protein
MPSGKATSGQELVAARLQASNLATLQEHVAEYCDAAVAGRGADVWVSIRSARKAARHVLVTEVSAGRSADPGSKVISRQGERF